MKRLSDKIPSRFRVANFSFFGQDLSFFIHTPPEVFILTAYIYCDKFYPMEVNQNLVKVSSGLMPVGRQLDLGDDICLKIEGTVVKIEHKDNQDGTYDRVAIVKGVLASEIAE